MLWFQDDSALIYCYIFFQVSLEECPSENFSNVSAEKCWQMVIQRLKLEIIKRCDQPASSLTALQALESIGLEMFAFLSPHVIQVTQLVFSYLALELWSLISCLIPLEHLPYSFA